MEFLVELLRERRAGCIADGVEVEERRVLRRERRVRVSASEPTAVLLDAF
jgi:hypothetical protein